MYPSSLRYLDIPDIINEGLKPCPEVNIPGPYFNKFIKGFEKYI